MQRPLGTLLKTSMWCDCLSESKWLLKHKDGCPYLSSHIRTYKSEGVVHRNALHAEQIMCQMSTSCHRRASFLWPNRTEQRAFVGSKMMNNRLLPQRLTAQWTHLGCPGPKHSVFMRPGTTTVETCPPKWGLTVWWPSKQGCAISLSLFPSLENHLLEEVCSHIENRQPLRSPCFQSKQEQWRLLQGLSGKVNKSPSSTQKQPPFLLIRVEKTQTAPAKASTALEPKNKQAARKEQEKTKKATQVVWQALWFPSVEETEVPICSHCGHSCEDVRICSSTLLSWEGFKQKGFKGKVKLNAFVRIQ